MTETPRPDPWANVKRYSVGAVEHHSVDSWYASTEAEEHPEGNWLKASEVDAARAAVDARHQAEIAKAVDDEQRRIATHVWEQLVPLGLDATDSDGIETEDPAEHIVMWAKGMLDREIATLRATVEQQAARITALEQALKQVLRFQYEHRGMGTYACRSCGAQAQLDEWVGIQRREACSPSCPWGVARQALETP